MTEAVFLVIGLAAGGAMGWLLAVTRARAAAARELVELREGIARAAGTETELRRQLAERDEALQQSRLDVQSAQQSRVEAEATLREALKSIDERRRQLDQAEEKLKDVFKAISVDALRQNSEQFAGAVKEQMRPLEEALKQYEQEIKRIELSRETAHGGITQELKRLAGVGEQLTQQTTSLATALRSPQVKGRWGELTLRRAVELAGLSRHCDFVEQAATEVGDSRLRPDLIVKLPGDRTIVVDAKAPTSAYLDALEANDESTRRDLLAQHARAVREHMQALAAKSYWNEFKNSPDFVVMFLPGEAFFSAALEQDRQLIEQEGPPKVILASPTTLIALLRVVAYGWQRQDLVENAHQIGLAARDLFDRVRRFGDHLARVGLNLRQATDAYNAAVGSWESRIRPAGNRLPELGATAAGEELTDLSVIDATPRSLPTEEVCRPADPPAAEERRMAPDREA